MTSLSYFTLHFLHCSLVFNLGRIIVLRIAAYEPFLIFMKSVLKIFETFHFVQNIHFQCLHSFQNIHHDVCSADLWSIFSCLFKGFCLQWWAYSHNPCQSISRLQLTVFTLFPSSLCSDLQKNYLLYRQGNSMKFHKVTSLYLEAFDIQSLLTLSIFLEAYIGLLYNWLTNPKITLQLHEVYSIHSCIFICFIADMSDYDLNADLTSTVAESLFLNPLNILLITLNQPFRLVLMIFIFSHFLSSPLFCFFKWFWFY